VFLPVVFLPVVFLPVVFLPVVFLPGERAVPGNGSSGRPHHGGFRCAIAA
jgi:hypothetical protein